MKLRRTDRQPVQRRSVPTEQRVKDKALRRQQSEQPRQKPEEALASLLSSMLDKLTAMMNRMNPASAPGAGKVGEVGGGRVGGMPELNPSSGSRSVFGGSPVFTGFDAQKLASPLKLGPDGQPASAKYTFAKLAQESGTMPRTKVEAEQWFNEHIKPGMEQAGFQVDWVKGDKAMIRTRENPQGEVVDFVRGADSKDPNYTALAWQSEGPVGASGSGGVGGGGFNKDFVLAILSKYPPTNEGIERAMEELRRQPGYEKARVLDHPLRLDKIDFGNGAVVDVIAGAGGPNPSWGWMPE